MEQHLAEIENAGGNGNERYQKYLTFTLADEDYGIEILKVKEIIGMMPITTVPRTPSFFKGVINLRGKVIPVVDLRLRFGMEEKEYTPQTCIVVVETSRSGITETMGIVVDSVSEVVNIKADDMEEALSLGDSVNKEFISGMAKMDGKVKILLDIDKVLDLTQEGAGTSEESISADNYAQ